MKYLISRPQIDTLLVSVNPPHPRRYTHTRLIIVKREGRFAGECFAAFAAAVHVHHVRLALGRVVDSVVFAVAGGGVVGAACGAGFGRGAPGGADLGAGFVGPDVAVLIIEGLLAFRALRIAPQTLTFRIAPL